MMLMPMAPMQAPSSEARPPTAAQTTMVMENDRSMKVGEANCATTTYSMPATPAMPADTAKKNTWYSGTSKPR